ncbi:KV12 protein, partial [Polypterus senegalus]
MAATPGDGAAMNCLVYAFDLFFVGKISVQYTGRNPNPYCCLLGPFTTGESAGYRDPEMTEGQDLNTVLQAMNVQLQALQQAQAATTRELEATKASAQITLTQSQSVVSGQSGETVTIKCQTSSSVYNSNYKVDILDWVQQRSGVPSRGIIYDGVHLVSGVPSRFSGSGGGTEFTLTITGVQHEDAGYYYCVQRLTTPHTVTES